MQVQFEELSQHFRRVNLSKFWLDLRKEEAHLR